VPQARIIIILRNPVERAFSQYMQMSNTGLYRLTFEEHIAACLVERTTDRISMVYPFLEYGLYSEQLDRYLAAFPRSQLGIWLYEETLLPGFLRQVFAFLGVHEEFVPDTSKRHLEQRIPRIPAMRRLLAEPHLSALLQVLVPVSLRPMLKQIVYRRRRNISMSIEVRRKLNDFYRADVAVLSQRLGKDLSQWLAD
jgi:hypothetical protein